MKVAILAGGVGTRLAEETEIRPKPMVEIGGKPILWHIMKHYERFGHSDFFIALGYKGHYIKKYMFEYSAFEGDLSLEMRTGRVRNGGGGVRSVPDWRLHLIDTGLNTNTGGRIKRLEPHLSDGTFFLTWGDGVSDIDLDRLLAFHRAHGKLCTVTAVRPPARFGHLVFEGDRVADFNEKPQAAEGWINGAFFVCEPEIFGYIEGDDTQFERAPMERLAREGELMAFKHDGFWQCMDTLRDKVRLQELWDTGSPPWKSWD